jgi:SAM-dependent methyltransferase
MPNQDIPMETVRRAWEAAADAYTQGQASGRDYFRYDIFGPAQAAMCGNVNGVRVLDVGCGNGYFAREMAIRGATVVGIDISSAMIAHAERLSRDIEYRVGDATRLPDYFPSASFDLATACVSLDDTSDPGRAIKAVFQVLRPGGRFVATITHPCTDTPYRKWELNEDGSKRALSIDRYFERGVCEFVWRGWPTEFATPWLHATLEDWMTWFLEAGFSLRALREPTPTKDALRRHPDFEGATRVPLFLIFDWLRPKDAARDVHTLPDARHW